MADLGIGYGLQIVDLHGRLEMAPAGRFDQSTNHSTVSNPFNQQFANH
jgi:hypothetical protein